MNYKHCRDERKDRRATGPGQACQCELCKLAGAPEVVYLSHYTHQCKKKDNYAKALSGGVAQRKATVKEYKSMERKLLKELKVIQNKQRKLTRKDHSESEDSEMDSDSSN